jgi:hypothetical protein
MGMMEVQNKERWNDGILEGWNKTAKKWWNIGILEQWQEASFRFSIVVGPSFLLHSIIPTFHYSGSQGSIIPDFSSGGWV